MRRPAAFFLACVLAAVGAVRPATAADPAAATVMIRVVGEITAALGPDGGGWRPSTELHDVQIATGSGFVISSDGYILTNSHVIHGGRRDVRVDGQLVDLTVTARRVFVVAPSRSDGDGPAQVVEAAVVADDTAIDLAVLHVSGVDLPVASLGDAGSLSRGDVVSAYGYPLGDRLAIGGPGSRTPPPVSASTGTVAALRDGGAANLPANVPYVQFTAPINPGNSGGPLADADGYVVGVVQAKIRQAEGVGLAIAMAEVKRFLERTGIDAALPVPRLTLGPLLDVPDKGLRVRLPAGALDASPSRARIDSGTSLGGVRLQIDRVVSGWDLERLERELQGGAAFGHGEFRAMPDRLRDYQPRGRSRLGLATQRADAGETRMLYALLGIGADVLVARFTGPADEIAFNLAVLRDSLLSIEAQSFVARPTAAPLRTRTMPVPPTPTVPPVAVVPAETMVDGASAAGCASLPPGESSLVMTPVADFTIRFGATRWAPGARAESVRRACLGEEAAPVMRSMSLGLAWTGERTVVTTAAGEPVLLELWAPEAKFALARPAFAAWADAVAGK